MSDMEISDEYAEWIRELDEDVIQGDYGYEPGEFSVFPEAWEAQFKAGRTPQEAFKRALDAFAEGRREEDAERKRRYAEIQEEDAFYLARNR